VTVIGHGGANSRAVANAIRTAARLSEDGLVDRVRQALAGGALSDSSRGLRSR
jgi:fatty acid/phospholipid biosynthesis enzyme